MSQSRIAKQPVILPSNVEVNLTAEEINVKGPKGNLSQAQNSLVEVVMSTDEASSAKILEFKTKDNSKRSKAMSGTMRALAANMVKGVSDGFEVILELVGVGYRAKAQGNAVDLSLGFSHPVKFALPEGVAAETPDNTTIILRSIDKQLLGQTGAEIRSLRPPEPYKGKGIKYRGERIVRKETKKK